MANTETMKVLRLVRKAMDDVWEAKDNAALGSDQKSMMSDLYDDLETLEGELILGVIDERIEALNSSSNKLEGVAKTIKQDIKELEAVADTVDKVARGVKILAKIVVTAASIPV